MYSYVTSKGGITVNYSSKTRLVIIAVLVTSFHAVCIARPIKPIPDELLIRAKREMNYKAELKLPPIIPTSSSALNDALQSRNGLVTMALYHKKKIYINKELKMNDLIARSIMYHELVHHVQHMRYGPTTNCKLWMRKEREAYRLQEKYLMEKGLNRSAVFKKILKSIECPSKTQV